MLFAFLLLGVLLGWIDSPRRDKWDEDGPLPKPPEFYLRPELIPVKELDTETPATADKYVRWWSRMYANGARR